MTLSEEFSKLAINKSIIRRAIQENGGILDTDANLVNYSSAIDGFSDDLDVDETNEAEYCRNSITQLVITVSKIRDYAFYHNTSLKELVLDVDSVIEFGPHSFKSTHFENDGIIYVPDELYDDYMASDWNVFNLARVSTFVADPKHLHPMESLDRYTKIEDLQNFTLNEILAQ